MDDLIIITFPTRDTKECRDVIYLASQFKNFVPAKNADYDNILSISLEEFIQRKVIVFRLLEILYEDMTGQHEDGRKLITGEIDNKSAVGVRMKFNLKAFIENAQYDFINEYIFKDRKN